MSNIREISQKISSVSSTRQITKAMKMVAASYFGKLNAMTIKLREFLESMEKILKKIEFTEEDFFFNPYLKKRKTKNVAFVVVSSDKGLCGAYNSNLFKFAKKNIEQFKSENSEKSFTIFPIGEKGISFFEKLDFPLNKDYFDLVHFFTYDKVRNLSQDLIKKFFDKELDEIFLIYTNFQTSSQAYPKIEKYLPIRIEDIKNTIEENVQNKVEDEYIFEASKDTTLQVLLPNYLGFQLYGAILKSKSSENSSRMITMSKAVENAESLLKDLTLEFNRTRQAIITQQISEVTAGAEVLKK